jgi:hypothetical protein
MKSIFIAVVLISTPIILTGGVLLNEWCDARKISLLKDTLYRHDCYLSNMLQGRIFLMHPEDRWLMTTNMPNNP